jgi:hypothetical protein
MDETLTTVPPEFLFCERSIPVHIGDLIAWSLLTKDPARTETLEAE